jgi:transporter family protein
MKAVLIALAAGLCWGIGEVFTKSVLHGREIGPLTAIAVRSTVALPFMWLVYAWFVHARAAEPRNWLQAEPATLGKLLLGSGLIAGAAGMILFYLALSVGEISRVKPIAFTVAPATAVLLGWLVLGETMSWNKAVGVLLVLAGVVLLASR